MIYRVEIRDRDMEFVNVADKRIGRLQWAYSPVGGCGQFSFSALSKYCTELEFGGNFNVRIKRRDPDTRDFNLIYQGRIENTINEVKDDIEVILVQGYGYQSELSDIRVSRNYSSTEVSAIVKSILDNDVVPNTNITYDSGDIEDTGFTADSIDFKYATALDCMSKLAEIVGSREWGVDKDRKFFFKARSDAEGFHYPLGKKARNLTINASSREIANRVIVLGKEESGTQYIYTKDYAKSQLKYNRRDYVIQNSAVSTSSVAEQLADAVYAERNGIVERGSVEIIDDRIFEETIPVPLIKIITREITYDEREYDTFLYAGQEAFRINEVSYNVDASGVLRSMLDLGMKTPNIVEDIKKLKFSIENILQSGG